MKKKYLWILGILLALLFISIPFLHVLGTKWKETVVSNNTPVGYTNDASQLNLTQVDTIIQVENSKANIEYKLRSILRYAQENDLKVSIAGAQHSMGGHTIYPGGILINMLPYKHMELDTISNILTIGSGALWEEAIRYLDKHGKSIAVMQAFSSFSVGGSISVNGHGWQKDLPPVSSSVLSFSLMDYNGNILQCSRTENPELFKLVIGGYGLFGIILDVKLRVVENTALQFKYVRLSPENYVAHYKNFVSSNPKVDLVFGRLRISDKLFLEEATLNFFEKVSEAPLPVQQQNNDENKRLVFRSSVDSEYGKRLRWDLETGMNKVTKNNVYSRNELLNDHVSMIENKDTSSTDLLQEYFIPERNFNRFIEEIKTVLQKSELDLLNITIRGVQKDEDSYLNYARESVFGFVFLFNQKKTKSQEEAMRVLTNQLVDVAIRNGGTFYLPYRLHIDRETMRMAYPQADTFFELKTKYDPKEIFSNKFYEHYK
ncbi:FAD-binding oxidoreductase [Pontibacter sp. BT310]|uniref:FAD-binding oxidoreductase n=1 Tax=Pontibacter populi TaxID=890055 RepID=A0ABS6XAC4_9BACT|nr:MULTISPECIES: FAD-binding oxidoreductase [Pontibacter]MBJ6118094.1 FAD-binding oxidoreductase [Pontibacter sp. BT310]MBR0570521.1 FAD-binding oxidoreductase [Microvirga sp. STS03]MBW3364947.1 FAD-binding oxidoreductase [Pontibacter populi]